MQPPKSEYVPYPHYQCVVKAKREKEKRLEEQLRLTQVASRKKKKDQSKPKLVHHPHHTISDANIIIANYRRGKGRWKDTTKTLEPSVGKFSRGVLKLSQKDIASVKAKNKRTKSSKR